MSDISRVRYFGVETLQEKLAAYVREKMTEKNLSTYDVARRSGGLITHQTVWSVLNAQGKDIKVGTLTALAKGLGVPEEEIFNVARGVEPVKESDLSDDKEIAALFYEYKEMSEEDKQELRTVMEMVGQEIRRRKQAGELVSQKKARAAQEAKEAKRSKGR